jgi:spermidine synthase
MPQRWHYMDEDFQFDLDEDQEGKLVLTWDKKLRPKPTDAKLMEQVRAWLRWEIRRLRRLKNIEWNFAFEERDHGIPRYEWDTIWEFVDANIVAMTVALEALGPSPPPEKAVVSTKGDVDKVEDTDHDDVFHPACAAEGGEDCEDLPPITARGSHYDPLDWEFDDLDYAKPTCNNRETMKFKDWDHLEFTKTTYQEMTFVEKPSTDDICMDLDNIVQICACYRPQYHEYVTHAAARFVKDIKRVIFIGGGDSMLLHEALRYPSLELVVGLELDQTVTRKCFKHFKTSPHFDDERVEWWFGDATKSLLLLPEEYWGSFDLVMVDLSETVMSLSVTTELDVFDALALLLNPVGVIVKNEMYLEKFSRVFDYTMELYYDTPIICSQVLVFGSNSVDFFHDPTYDHNITTFLYGNMHDPHTRHNLMHDYRKNIAPPAACNLEIPEEPTEQRTAAGICEIVNAEDVSVVLIHEKISAILTGAAKRANFTVLQEPVFDNRMVVLMMKEGYIAARMWPPERYIGFDINLWGNTYKIDSVRADLLLAVHSKGDVSSYRVVVGGMYGSNTWREDQKILGPKVRQLRNCERDVVTEGSLDADLAIDVSVEESVALTLDDEVSAVVVCGEGDPECSSVKVLRDHKMVSNVIVLQECPGLKVAELEEKFACEVKLLDEWKAALKDIPKTNLVVMHPTASYEMHQILSSIFSQYRIRDDILDGEHSIVVTWSNDKDGETWRREFLDRLRKAVEHDPMARAEIVFQAGGRTAELGIASTGNAKANYALEKLEKKLRERLPGIAIELRKIAGGLFQFQTDAMYNPKHFTLSDYDDGTGKAQFAGQKPMGRQTIFQLVKSEEEVEDLALNMPHLWQCLKQAMESVKMVPTLTRQYPDYVGDGGAILALSAVGNVILVWDGREHVDVNFFTFDEHIGLPETFMGSFLSHAERKLTVGLRDDQPRGVGRVINFAGDLLPVDPSAKTQGSKKRIVRKVEGGVGGAPPKPREEL